MSKFDKNWLKITFSSCDMSVNVIYVTWEKQKHTLRNERNKNSESTPGEFWVL